MPSEAELSTSVLSTLVKGLSDTSQTGNFPGDICQPLQNFPHLFPWQVSHLDYAEAISNRIDSLWLNTIQWPNLKKKQFEFKHHRCQSVALANPNLGFIKTRACQASTVPLCLTGFMRGSFHCLAAWPDLALSNSDRTLPCLHLKYANHYAR